MPMVSLKLMARRCFFCRNSFHMNHESHPHMEITDRTADEAARARAEDGANLWSLGQPVEAKWKAQNAIWLRGAGKWFPGRIASVPDDEGRCDVMYDDGDFEALVPGRFLRAPLAVPALKHHSRQSRPSTQLSTQASNSWAAAALAAASPSVPDPSSSPASRKRPVTQQQGTDQSPKDPHKRPRGPVPKGGTGGTGGAGGKGGKSSIGSSRQSHSAPVVDKLKAALARMKDLFDSGLLPENIYEAKVKTLLGLPLA